VIVGCADAGWILDPPKLEVFWTVVVALSVAVVNTFMRL
jgi:hypothetical protein